MKKPYLLVCYRPDGDETVPFYAPTIQNLKDYFAGLQTVMSNKDRKTVCAVIGRVNPGSKSNTPLLTKRPGSKWEAFVCSQCHEIECHSAHPKI